MAKRIVSQRPSTTQNQPGNCHGDYKERVMDSVQIPQRVTWEQFSVPLKFNDRL